MQDWTWGAPTLLPHAAAAAAAAAAAPSSTRLDSARPGARAHERVVEPRATVPIPAGMGANNRGTSRHREADVAVAVD
jgi:hypothetical protein